LDAAPPQPYPLSLHDALPIWARRCRPRPPARAPTPPAPDHRTRGTMAALLALGAAAAYGIGDFLGGVAARRVAASAVVLWSHVVGLVLLVGLAPLASGEPTSRALAVGALAGVLGGGGVALFYRGLAVGSMSVGAPVAALLSAGVPVVVGLATGERPACAALVGIVLALGAVVLISREPQQLGASPLRWR